METRAPMIGVCVRESVTVPRMSPPRSWAIGARGSEDGREACGNCSQDRAARAANQG